MTSYSYRLAPEMEAENTEAMSGPISDKPSYKRRPGTGVRRTDTKAPKMPMTFQIRTI